MDFGLCPQLVSEKIISELLKMILENRENDNGKKMSATYISSFHSDFNSTSISNPAHFSSPFSPSSSSSTFKPTISSSVDCKSYKSGLGFCEFIELIAAIAVEGLKTEEKNLFPTAFSKVINWYWNLLKEFYFYSLLNLGLFFFTFLFWSVLFLSDYMI